MRRLIALLMLLAVLPFAAAAELPDITTLTVDELLLLWQQSGELLRQAGYYPYVELTLKDSGDDITALQSRLAQLYYFTKAISGKYDSNTANAMKAFEKANGLKVDGVASIDDQKLLFSDAAAAKGTPTPKPSPTPKPTPRIASPANIKCTATTGSVKITWTAVKSAETYNIYRSTTSAGSYTLIATVQSASYTDTKVSKGATYYYQIETVAGDNVSKLSAAKKAAVPTPTPTPDPRKAYGSLSYTEYFRYPEYYQNDKFKVTGTVLQVMGTRYSGFDLRVATRGRWDNIIYVTVGFDPGFNILEDDKVTIYCRGEGTYTYEAVSGASITLPSFECDMIDLR